jgi:hypothetical protein
MNLHFKRDFRNFPKFYFILFPGVCVEKTTKSYCWEKKTLHRLLLFQMLSLFDSKLSEIPKSWGAMKKTQETWIYIFNHY